MNEIKTRTSPSHQRYLDAGCTLSRTEVGKPSPTVPTLIHYYGLCRLCCVEMHDVNDRGFEECSSSPYNNSYYGEADITICTSCAGALYRAQANLEGRIARCTYCRKEKDSSFSLPFFDYHGEGTTKNILPNDIYYCGCRGWD